MASPEAHVAEQLKGIPGYRDPFAKAFPGEPDLVTLANVEKISRTRAAAALPSVIGGPCGDLFRRSELGASSLPGGRRRWSIFAPVAGLSTLLGSGTGAPLSTAAG
jgi:hypothetical protein